ncbi:MAG: hypothetical protein SCH72_15060, partial [Desulfuromonadales bacterium]|nr:hypothetical protein [Desulfuromonadales bacterium]
ILQFAHIAGKGVSSQTSQSVGADIPNQSIPRRGLPAGEILASLALNHIIDRETLNLLSKWYQDTALEDFTKIPSGKLNSTNLGAVMGTIKKLVPEGMVDVCIKLFDQIKHLENGSASLLYDITSTYFYTTKLPKARHGHNRDENNQPQINISLVATKDKGLPIFFRTYEGTPPPPTLFSSPVQVVGPS